MAGLASRVVPLIVLSIGSVFGFASFVHFRLVSNADAAHGTRHIEVERNIDGARIRGVRPGDDIQAHRLRGARNRRG